MIEIAERILMAKMEGIISLKEKKEGDLRAGLSKERGGISTERYLIIEIKEELLENAD